MYRRQLRILFPSFLFLSWCGLCVFAFPARAQEEPPPGPDSHETGQGPHGHLFGNWGGERTRLLERCVKFDFQYVSDSLWNIESEQKERFASWNRFRWTVDIDFGALTGVQGLYFHATALWQGGGNLGAYLGLLTSPSGMSSENTCRLDSWWIEKRWLNERIRARVGQFAGQDFYGAQHYAASFIFEPMGYALGNLFTTLESFDPPSTPAMEVCMVPVRNVYVKLMVMAAVREPFSQNPTGLVPQFNGTPVSASEIAFTSGKNASSVRAFDDVEGRKGYSGLYQFGATYNPAKFTSPTSATPRSGNYLLYWMASQASTRKEERAWTRRLRTTGVRRASIVTTPCSPRGCVSTSRFLWAFTTRCHWAICETVLARSSFRLGCLRGRPSKVLSSIYCRTFCQCCFCSR
jgi:porin